MNESRKMGSIARSLNREAAFGLLRALLLLDLALAALLAGGFLYFAELNEIGAYSEQTQRYLRADDTLSGRAYVDSVEYVLCDEQGVEHAVRIAAYLTTLEKLVPPLLWLEAAMLVWRAVFGKRRVRLRLRPLDAMAAAAQKLSEQARADQRGEARIHSLEDALYSVRPGESAIRLGFDDADLVGLEKAINDLLERTQAAYRQQTRFVSDASHELRTPIAVIQGYAAMLDRWGKSDPQVLAESITAIRAESEHMNRLVEQLLFLARGDSGRQKMSFERFSLAELMKSVYEEYEMIDHAHVWRLACAEEVYCVGDASMLKQAARILADNAVKYTPEGGTVRLRAGYREATPFFEVQDEGMGVSPADAPHIFERFYRADPSREGKTGGTGLGLSIAKWIVDRHAGYFELLSRPGLGTRIGVYLPETSFAGE